jgi:sec-independent protein translocase protein TatB
MLGVGWTEMLVIGVVALIVIGPKELPAVMHRIGKFAGMVRRMGSDFQRELNKTTGLNEITNLRQAVTAPLKATTDAIRKEFNATTAGIVQPTGVLKPADPKVESVVSAIEEKAGITRPATGALPATPVVPPKSEVKPEAAAASKPRRTTKAKPAEAAAAPVSGPAKSAPKRAARPKSQPASTPPAVAGAAPAPAKAAARPRATKVAGTAARPAGPAAPKAAVRRKPAAAKTS